ncbi:MAG: DNA-binding protein [Aigarchaeota archaeon]|nr:DNA-binding protein [Aigarchaeota archaeon]
MAKIKLSTFAIQVTALENRYVTRLGNRGRVLVTRIMPGSDLIQSIRTVVEEHGIKAGVIISGVGLLRRAHLRNCRALPKEYPITDTNRSFLTFERPLEILALSGNISEVEGKPWVHVHITLSYIEGETVRVIGGHLLEGSVIFGFAEVFIMELRDIEMKKSFDEETKTLQLFAQNRQSSA